MGTDTAYSFKTVILNGSEYCIQMERKAGEAGIYPGMFLKFQSDGDFELQDESETICPKLIAVEDDGQGAPISTVYTSGARCIARWLAPGTQFFGWLAPGHTSAIGSMLTSAGYESPGALGVAQQSSANLGAGVVAIALEAITNSGADAVRCWMVAI